VRLVADALLGLQEEDVKAYAQLVRARAQGGPEELAAALEEAVACPLRIMQQAQEGLALLSQVGCRCKLHLISDLLVACELLGAAFRGALYIAWANLPLMPSETRLAIWAETLFTTFCALEVELQQVRVELLGRAA
jgi:formiminotetrahydrofolate cyclodeaminase